jgi:hypothetical protein
MIKSAGQAGAASRQAVKITSFNFMVKNTSLTRIFAAGIHPEQAGNTLNAVVIVLQPLLDFMQLDFLVMQGRF